MSKRFYTALAQDLLVSVWHKICCDSGAQFFGRAGFGTQFAADFVRHDFCCKKVLAQDLLWAGFGTRFAGRELAQDLLQKLCRLVRKKILQACRKKV